MSFRDRKEYAAFVKCCGDNAAKQRQRLQDAGARAAQALWNSSVPADSDHPYLKAKGVPAIELRMESRGNLRIPVRDADGKLISFRKIPAEKIDEKWAEFFVSGGKTAGGFYPVPAKDGKKNGPLLIG